MARTRRRQRRRATKTRKQRRRQQGGAGSSVSNIAEWQSRVRADRDALAARLADIRGEEQITYTFADLRKESLHLPPMVPQEEGLFDLSVPYATKDARAIASNIRGFLEQFINGQGTVLSMTEESFQRAMRQLAQNDSSYKESLAMLVAVETALRSGRTPVSASLDATADYPLYLWYLVANSEGEAVPILEATPAQQAPYATVE